MDPRRDIAAFLADHFAPEAFEAAVRAIGDELGAWVDGADDPVAGRHAVRGPLRTATPEEHVAIDAASYAEWGDPGPGDAFAAREARLREGAWSRSSQLAWVLPERASCETYRMACTGGSAWGVASVYVAPALRGRGNASQLLSALADRLATERGARALVLFSDVGAPIYERLGFVARPAVDRVWPAESADPDDGPWRRFAEAELAAAHARLRPTGGPFAIWPSAAQLGWHLDRGDRRTTPCGALLGDDAIVWTPRDGELLVLLVTSAAVETTTALMAAAARTAATAGLARVRAWEVPIPWPSTAVAEPRHGALPMIRPLRAGVEAAGWTWIPRGVWI